MEKIQNYINGEFSKPVSNQYLEVFEPATGAPYALVPNSNRLDVENAYVSAKKAFKNWSSITIQERSEYLNLIADKIEEKLNLFSEFESRDTGKPIQLSSSMDIPRSIYNLKFFAQYSEEYNFNFKLTNKTSQSRVVSKPLGVVGCISPWNLPLYLFTWKIAPALITGNTVIAKPSEITPYTAFKFSEICNEVGLPSGVLNIIHGEGAIVGDAIISHNDLKAISFTGGTQTGMKIANKTAASFKKMALEMGGKNPAIIFSDCDYDKMIKTVIKSTFTNQGQICLCSSRILVEKTLYEKFKKDFIRKTSEIIIGDPKEKEVEFGAVSSKAHFDKILNYIKVARDEGGSILFGGHPIKLNNRCSTGWFIQPTIMEGLSNKSKINQEEIFGPLVTLIPFENENEAINIANDTNYGLSATIWSEDNLKLDRVSNKVNAGVIWTNCWLVRDLRTPFGGMKNSGYGREGGQEAMRFFTEQKTICKTI